MYVEFVIGYAISGFIIILLLAVLVLQLVILKRISRSNVQSLGSRALNEHAHHTTAICRNCAARFDAAYSVCPKCGAPR